MNIRRRDACLFLATAFGLGVFTGHQLSGPPSPPTPPSRSPFEERGPPTKVELGQAGWTLLHTIAANYPERPTSRQQAGLEHFLHALGHLYPCPDCARHFRQHTSLHPIASASREALSLWMCAAHNEVNVRNAKEPFYCDIGVLDARWKDCGCGGNKTSSAASEAPAEAAEAVMPPRRGRRRSMRIKSER